MASCDKCGGEISTGGSTICEACAAAVTPADAPRKTIFGFAPAALMPVAPPPATQTGSQAAKPRSVVPRSVVPRHAQQVIKLSDVPVDDAARTLAPTSAVAAALLSRVAGLPPPPSDPLLDQLPKTDPELDAETGRPVDRLALSKLETIISSEPATAQPTTIEPPAAADERKTILGLPDPQPVTDPRPAGEPPPAQPVFLVSAASPFSAAPAPPDRPAETPAAPPAPAMERPAADTEWRMSGGSLRDSGLPGLKLFEGERLIAVERPGAFFWILFGIFCALVVTLPLALWMLFRSAGQVYVVTTQRAVRISRLGSVTQLLHSDLHSVRLVGFVGASQVSLELLPKPSSGARPLRFGLCGPAGAMTRLWGVIIFWVLGETVAAEQAPEVDASGALVAVDHGLDLEILDKTCYRQGIDLSQAQRSGVTVLTPTRLIWAREEDAGSGGRVHATIPVCGFIRAVAGRAGDAAEVEAEIERVAKAGALAEVVSRRWDRLGELRLSSHKGLQFVDTTDGLEASVRFPERHRQPLRAYLERHRIALSG